MKSALILLITCCSFNLFGQSVYFPPASGEWETLPPDSLGYCQENIDSLFTFLEDGESKSFILLKDGKIVLEKYFGNHGPDSLWVWFSAGKSLTAVLVGIAQQQGALSIHDKTSDYLGKWTTLDQQKEDLITIRHQLTMTTGLDESDFTCTDSACLRYKADAGTRWAYHNAPYSLLVDVVKQATGKDYNIFAHQNLKSKIGMSGFWAPFGYNHFYWSNARSMARFGLLMYAGGTWDGTPVITDTAYYRDMITRSQPLNPAYGYLWWLNSGDSVRYPGLDSLIPGRMTPAAPADMYAAEGAQGQFICIVPSEGLVVIRQGIESFDTAISVNFLDKMWQRIMGLPCNPVSIAPEPKPEFSIRPNPADQYIELVAPGMETIQQVNILNNLGENVLTVSPGDNRIDVSNLVPGTYILRVEGKSVVWFGRFTRM